MEVVVLSIHLLVCICLIGLVLLQRSEGGALGMGGGGGGALMSGRGAADALAKMTQVAGGFFLVTSLGLTVLSGAGASNSGSILDNVTLPAATAPAATTPAPAATTPAAPAEQPAETRPDPTESSIPATTQLASAPAAETAAQRAAPLNAMATPTSANRPVQTASVQPRPQAPAQQRSTPATARTTPALILPNSSGAVTGISLDDDDANAIESIEVGNGVEAVRRDQRAGPDQ
jgi:preprotein translocase subunit SecG